MNVSDPLKPRCHAHNRQGQQCGMLSVPGARVCRMHGGRAPQVLASAEERIRSLAPRAIDVMEQLLDDDEAGALRLAAAKDILDRAGYKPREKVDVNVQTMKALERSAWESL